MATIIAEATGGNTVTAYWEGSRDGANWAHDFDVTHRKVNRQPG